MIISENYTTNFWTPQSTLACFRHKNKVQDPRVHVFTLSHSAGQPCYTALPQRPAGDSCSHLPRQDFSSSTFRPTGQNKREMLSPFPFPSLRRLLFKETLPSKKGIAAALGFPPRPSTLPLCDVPFPRIC